MNPKLSHESVNSRVLVYNIRPKDILFDRKDTSMNFDDENQIFEKRRRLHDRLE